MSKHKKTRPETEQAKYQLTAREKTAVEQHAARMAAEPTAPSMRVSNDEEAPKIEPHHPDKVIGYALLMEALGTADYDFGMGIRRQLANAGSHGDVIDEAGINFLLSVVKGIRRGISSRRC